MSFHWSVVLGALVRQYRTTGIAFIRYMLRRGHAFRRAMTRTNMWQQSGLEFNRSTVRSLPIVPQLMMPDIYTNYFQYKFLVSVFYAKHTFLCLITNVAPAEIKRWNTSLKIDSMNLIKCELNIILSRKLIVMRFRVKTSTNFWSTKSFVRFDISSINVGIIYVSSFTFSSVNILRRCQIIYDLFFFALFHYSR